MEKWTLGQLGKTKPKQSQFKPNSKPIQSQNKPNSNPIYPVVASGEAGTKPIYRGMAGKKPVSKEVFTREMSDIQLSAQITFSDNILPGRTL